MPTHHTIYRRPTPNGDIQRQVSGLPIPSPVTVTDVATYPFAKAALDAAGIVPRAGDRLQDDAGRGWTVVAAELAAGVYAVDCEGDPVDDE